MLVAVVDDHRFRAMGTDCHVQVLTGPPGAVEVAEAVVRGDEARWSRFRADSEVCRLGTGRAVRVSPETAALLALALDWRERTGRRFDPLLGRELRAAGYDRPFDQLRRGGPVDARPPGRRRAGVVSLTGDVVTVPPGTEIDVGGIAKGHSADRAVGAVLDAGAAGACVNLGGDLRCAGEAPAGDGWWTALDHGERAEASRFAVGLAHGAVATSTTRRRRWTTTAGAEHHHLLDPHTGRPADTVFDTVTVVAALASTAEVLTKVVLLAPVAEAQALLDAHSAVAVATDRAGAMHRFGDVDPLLAPLDTLPDHTVRLDPRSEQPWS